MFFLQRLPGCCEILACGMQIFSCANSCYARHWFLGGAAATFMYHWFSQLATEKIGPKPGRGFK